LSLTYDTTLLSNNNNIFSDFIVSLGNSMGPMTANSIY
jgi:hypothetical protein